MELNNLQKISLVGCFLMGIGNFLPVMSVPFVGSINYVGNGEGGDGLIVLGLAVFAALCVFGGKVKWARVPAFMAGGVMIVTILNYLDVIGGSPFGSMVRLEWGWLVLFAGCGLILYAGFSPQPEAAFEIDERDLISFDK